MSSLHIRLAAWNAAANPTNSQVTAVTALKNGVACGNNEGRIWLYALETSGAPRQEGDTDGIHLRPKCLLSAHRAPIVALRTAHISSSSTEGSEETVISVSSDGDVIMWSAMDGRCISRARAVPQEVMLHPSTVGVSLQTVEYQSAAEDLLFVFGHGPAVRVFSYPSLEIVYEWTAPHPAEWITAHALRKRKDHFGSQLITCTTTGTIRIWRYDEFALAQQDVFSRSASPTIAVPAIMDPSAVSAAGSGTESAYSDGEGAGAESPGPGARNTPMFQLETQYESSLSGSDSEAAVSSLVVNPYNDDEFLAVSPALVRLFATQKGELHEVLRWKPPLQRSMGASFSGAGFLTKADIVLWDSAGNVLSVCSLFSVQGGSAGLHLTRSRYFEATGRVPEHAVTSLVNVWSVDAASALGRAVGHKDGTSVNVLLTYTSTTGDHTLTLALPLPLSSVSGSANNPHTAGPEDSSLASAKRKQVEVPWIGSPSVFRMSTLWEEWIGRVCGARDVTSALVLRSGRLALGYSDGTIQLMSPTSMMVNQQIVADSSISLTGHKRTICALYEWEAPSGRGGAVPPNKQSDESEDHSNASSIGCLLVSASKDLTLRIWDLATGTCLNVVATQSAPIVHLSAVLPTNRVAWQEVERHETLCAELDAMVLGIGSDNSTTLVSMRILDRVHVTASHHSQPVRVSVSWDRARINVCYADSTRHALSVAHLVGGSDDDRDTTVPEDTDESGAPSICSAYLLPLIASSSAATTTMREATAGGTGRPVHWAKASLLLPASLRYALSGSTATPPAALVLEIDVMGLQASAARAAPEGTDMGAMRALLDRENCCKSASPLRTSLMLLSVLCTWGVSDDLDAVKRRVFAMQQPLGNVSLAIGSLQGDSTCTTVMFPDPRNRCASWCVSPLLNAQRMLAILVLSRSVLQGDEQKAVEVINFYVGKLQTEVGLHFKPLSLQTLAQYWQSLNASLQRAARTLVFSVIHGAPERLRRAELFYWSSLLARCAPGMLDSEGLYALTIVCVIGTDFPALLPLTARSMAATMLQALVTMDRTRVRARMVAIELLSRGFATFKPYLDCHAVIRSLLSIMMSVSEETTAHSSSSGGGSSHGRPHLGIASVDRMDGEGGLGIRRTMSGASMPALGSMVAAQSQRHTSRARTPADGASEVPRPIPVPGGHGRGGSGGSLAATPTETLSSVARAAMTTAAWRAHGDHRQAEVPAQQQQQPKPGSYDARGAVPSRRPLRSRAASMAGADISGGGAVSFNMIVLAKSALLRICASDASVVSSAVNEILRCSGDDDFSGAAHHDYSIAELQKEQRGALQLVGLAAQKYPTHMYAHLESLAAAIVQAIDPKRATERRALIGAAGAALQGLVRAYPCVAFHPESQCLVVGGIGGACTAYDLRTATRTAVFDALAASPVAAVAVSPAGDRVASFTLGDGALSIWDPSPSALAMFARSLFWSSSSSAAIASEADRSADTSPPLPAQGSVRASKTMKIPAGFLDHADELPISSVMAVAKLTWSGDRSVVLQVQEATFTLSV
ncbi:hypothetical protein IW138_001253 [Coemansia sp. RSA 986]|nr:hypothetical protein IW138_001253 [Coemansia sp. RSA 986]